MIKPALDLARRLSTEHHKWGVTARRVLAMTLRLPLTKRIIPTAVDACS